MYLVVLKASEDTSSAAVGQALEIIESDVDRLAKRLALLTNNQTLIELDPTFSV